jgi:hypothetical protein
VNIAFYIFNHTMANISCIDCDVQIMYELVSYLNSNRSFDVVEFAFLQYSIIEHFQLFIEKLKMSLGNNCRICKNENLCVVLKLDKVFVKISPSTLDFPIQTMKIHCLEEVI